MSADALATINLSNSEQSKQCLGVGVEGWVIIGKNILVYFMFQSI